MINRLWVLAAAAAICLGTVTGSAAHESRCFTTDDGAYSCELRVIDEQGSLQITAPGRPTYILQITEPDIAFGLAIMGGGTVRLPAEFRRRKDDPACWQNVLTHTEICVW